MTGLLLISGTVQADLNIFACEAEWAALAREIAGDRVEITSATTGMQDVHHIQARPSLIAKARQADLLFCTGAELESGWLPMLMRKANNPRIQPGRTGHLMASDFVIMLDKRERVDRSEGDIHAAGNPHIQTNPHNMLPVADELARRLGQIDPEHARIYMKNLEGFEQRMTAAIAGWERLAKPLKGTKLILHHQSWIYLLNWLGMVSVGTLEPKPGIPPTSGQLSKLLAQLEQAPADLIVYASYQDDRAAHWLAGRTGIPAVALPMTIGGTDKAKDLFSFYDDLLDRLLTRKK